MGESWHRQLCPSHCRCHPVATPALCCSLYNRWVEGEITESTKARHRVCKGAAWQHSFLVFTPIPALLKKESCLWVLCKDTGWQGEKYGRNTPLLQAEPRGKCTILCSCFAIVFHLFFRELRILYNLLFSQTSHETHTYVPPAIVYHLSSVRTTSLAP